MALPAHITVARLVHHLFAAAEPARPAGLHGRLQYTLSDVTDLGRGEVLVKLAIKRLEFWLSNVQSPLRFGRF